MKKKLLLAATFLLNLTVALSGEVILNPTILYVGDSHSYGKLGTIVEKRLSHISDHVIMESSCGSTANTWLGKSGFEKTVCGFWKKDGSEDIRSVNHQVPKFSEELEKYQPQVVIVQLGTNMAAGSKPSNSIASIQEMMKQIKAANAICIWIGPPDANSKIVTTKKLKIVNDLLIKLSEENDCHYIDSLKLTKFPKSSSEGIHYPPELAAKWGEQISTEILTILRNPADFK
jgi:hypothetical protein